MTESECDDKSDHCEPSGTTNCNPILSKIQYMEDQCKDIFDKASHSIKKAQKHQAKGYNNRQTKGKPFKIGDKCLKQNCKDDSCKAKMCRCFLGPYTVVAKCGANAYYLMDRHSHKLVHSVPGSQLVHFYEKAKYKSDGITSEIEPMNTDIESVESDDENNSSITCQRVFSKIPSPKTSMPKKRCSITDCDYF